MGQYDYKELFEKAVSKEATQDDIKKLYDWFQQYGQQYWNGEYFETEKNLRLYPIYKKVNDDFILIGYKFE